MEVLIGLAVVAVAAVFFIKSRQEKSLSTFVQNSELLYYKQGSSRGKKATEISIDTEGKATIVTGKDSTKTVVLDKEQREELKRLLDAVFSEKIEETYLTGARDLPKITLRYQGTSVVFHNRTAPDNLVSLARKVSAMTVSK